ncbi:predicted protein [Postia placenta Mad-698-R]|nr:predicted protein [Postia placenta Mad-698-R]
MSTDTSRLHSKLDTLSDALDDLETKLEPLFAQTLPETVVGLETIQQAKLQVALPYLVYDLIFIYLKTRGIDPKTHPVVAELDRIRQYFDKIKNAEDPAKRTATVDKDAANRFIKHAIAQVKAQRPPGGGEGPSNIRFTDSGEAVRVPVKVTSKMAARAQYEKELAELGSEEEGELEVIDDAGDADDEAASSEPRQDKGKGKAVDSADAGEQMPGRKRRCAPMDPFAGHGDDTTAQTIKKSRASAVAADAEKVNSTPDSSGRSTPSSSAEAAKKERKAAKKARKKAKRGESTD